MSRKPFSLIAFSLLLPGWALADITATVNLPVGQQLDLDRGSVGSSGDFSWDGSTLTPQGGALYTVVGSNVGGINPCDTLTQQLVAVFPSNVSTPFASAGFPGVSSFCLVFKTRGNNRAKVTLTKTAASGAAASINFTTYGVTGGGGGGGTGGGANAPQVSTIKNNYSNISPGLPNFGLAPGSIFYIQGSNLANTTTDLLSSASPGLQTTVSGVTVTVNAGGQSAPCPLYYLSPRQINAILPSNTALGSATITVNNNGQSGTFQIVVVQSAFGILSYNGSLGAVYDASNAILTTANSANPNQAVVLWGSGVGGDPQADDKLFPQRQNNLTNIPMQVFVGGISATIAYRGRSQFPGVDQVVVTIPGNVPTGCFVSLIVVSNTIVSNSVTIPIAGSGRTCSDTVGALPPNIANSLIGKTTVKLGFLGVNQTTLVDPRFGSQRSDLVFGSFQSSTTAGSSVGQVSIGSCVVLTSETGTAGTITGLDAGATISVTGPAGSLQMSKLSVPGAPSGIYTTANGTVPAGFVVAGSFNFVGTGGSDVGAFNANLAAPSALSWTNEPQITGVTRAQGVTVNWTGGQNGAYVTITGSSTSGTTSVTFTCIAPVSAGTFTVPAGILLALPAGNNGSLSVNTSSNLQTFTASGLDLGLLSASSGTSKTVNYN